MTILSAITAYVDALINTKNFATILEGYHGEIIKDAISTLYGSSDYSTVNAVGSDYNLARDQKARLAVALRQLGAKFYGIDAAKEYHAGNDEVSNEGVMLRGNVVTSSWGYGQTNTDFYLVVRRTKTMVTLLPMDSGIAEQDNAMAGKLVPTNAQYEAQPIRRKVYSYGSGERCNDLHGHGSCKNLSGRALYYSSYH